MQIAKLYMITMDMISMDMISMDMISMERCCWHASSPTPRLEHFLWHFYTPCHSSLPSFHHSLYPPPPLYPYQSQPPLSPSLPPAQPPPSFSPSPGRPSIFTSAQSPFSFHLPLPSIPSWLFTSCCPLSFCLSLFYPLPQSPPSLHLPPVISLSLPSLNLPSLFTFPQSSLFLYLPPFYPLSLPSPSHPSSSFFTFPHSPLSLYLQSPHLFYSYITHLNQSPPKSNGSGGIN